MNAYALMFFLVLSNFNINAENKFVIGCRKSEGFFAAFFSTLTHLFWCDRAGKTPVVYWDSESLYYQPEGYNGSLNVWEYYFEPVSKLKYEAGDSIRRSWTDPTGYVLELIMPNCWNKNQVKSYRQDVKRLIDKYVKIKPSIQEKIDKFYKDNMKGKKTVGLHLRGTDKVAETRKIPTNVLIAEANKHSDCQYLICTDEAALLEEAKKTLNGKVIYYDCFRSDDGTPVHKNDSKNYSKAKAGEDVLIDAQLLARCDHFIHTYSCVSSAVLFFNPFLERTVFDNGL